MFYVYEWYIEETNEIFYVGKGSKKRRGQISRRNKLFKEVYNNNKCKSRILKTFEDEEDAFKYEHQRITELKQQGLCKCNLDYGGKGGCHFIWTPEMRDYYSKYNVMKDKKQRERMSKNNPMKNKNIAKLVAEKTKKPFYIGNTLYETLEEASKKYNKTIQCIRYWLEVGHNKEELCYYKGDKPKDYDFSKNPHICKGTKIIYDNKVYDSIYQLKKELNIHHEKISRCLRNGKPLNGKKVEYYNMTISSQANESQ